VAGRGRANVPNERRGVEIQRRVGSIWMLASRSTSGLSFSSPSPSHGDQFVAVLWPVMKRLGVEVRAVRPLDSPERRIELDRVEYGEVLQWREHLAFKDGPKVDLLSSAVGKLQCQNVWTDDGEALDAVDGVGHELPFSSTQRLDLERSPAGLQEGPILQEFVPMDLGPSLDKPLLFPRKITAHALNRVKREDALVFLIRGMRPMVRRADLHEHSNDDSEEP
jgi:hypothetical protein